LVYFEGLFAGPKPAGENAPRRAPCIDWRVYKMKQGGKDKADECKEKKDATDMLGQSKGGEKGGGQGGSHTKGGVTEGASLVKGKHKAKQDKEGWEGVRVPGKQEVLKLTWFRTVVNVN